MIEKGDDGDSPDAKQIEAVKVEYILRATPFIKNEIRKMKGIGDKSIDEDNADEAKEESE